MSASAARLRSLDDMRGRLSKRPCIMAGSTVVNRNQQDRHEADFSDFRPLQQDLPGAVTGPPRIGRILPEDRIGAEAPESSEYYGITRPSSRRCVASCISGSPMIEVKSAV